MKFYIYILMIFLAFVFTSGCNKDNKTVCERLDSKTESGFNLSGNTYIIRGFGHTKNGKEIKKDNDFYYENYPMTRYITFTNDGTVKGNIAVIIFGYWDKVPRSKNDLKIQIQNASFFEPLSLPKKMIKAMNDCVCYTHRDSTTYLYFNKDEDNHNILILEQL